MNISDWVEKIESEAKTFDTRGYTSKCEICGNRDVCDDKLTCPNCGELEDFEVFGWYIYELMEFDDDWDWTFAVVFQVRCKTCFYNDAEMDIMMGDITENLNESGDLWRDLIDLKPPPANRF